MEARTRKRQVIEPGIGTGRGRGYGEETERKGDRPCGRDRERGVYRLRQG